MNHFAAEGTYSSKSALFRTAVGLAPQQKVLEIILDSHRKSRFRGPGPVQIAFELVFQLIIMMAGWGLINLVESLWQQHRTILLIASTTLALALILLVLKIRSRRTSNSHRKTPR
jgi:hypothetical protein